MFVCCILWIFAALAGIENYPAEGASWSQLISTKYFCCKFSAKVGSQDPERWSLWCDAKRDDAIQMVGGLLDVNFD